MPHGLQHEGLPRGAFMHLRWSSGGQSGRSVTGAPRWRRLLRWAGSCRRSSPGCGRDGSGDRAARRQPLGGEHASSLVDWYV